ncbi:MAG TPA: hypothetical protein V6C82_08275 [Chroococcales cyanobacterium]|jgi:hypothetical protein
MIQIFKKWGTPAAGQSSPKLKERFKQAGPQAGPEFSDFLGQIERLRQRGAADSEGRRLLERSLRKTAFLLWMGMIDFIPAGFRLQQETYPFEEKMRCLKEAVESVEDEGLRANLGSILSSELSPELPPAWQSKISSMPWQTGVELAWIFSALEKFIPFLPPSPRFALRAFMKKNESARDFEGLLKLAHPLLDLCARASNGEAESIRLLAASANQQKTVGDRGTLSFSPLHRIQQTALLPEIRLA